MHITPSFPDDNGTVKGAVASVQLSLYISQSVRDYRGVRVSCEVRSPEQRLQ